MDVECIWVVLPGTEVAHSDVVDVSGCVLLRTEVAKINGWRSHNIGFNYMTSSLGSTQINYTQCL